MYVAQVVDTESVTNFVINKVPTQAVFETMIDNNQVNENELYFIEDTAFGNIVSFNVVEVTS